MSKRSSDAAFEDSDTGGADATANRTMIMPEFVDARGHKCRFVSFVNWIGNCGKAIFFRGGLRRAEGKLGDEFPPDTVIPVFGCIPKLICQLRCACPSCEAQSIPIPQVALTSELFRMLW